MSGTISATGTTKIGYTGQIVTETIAATGYYDITAVGVAGGATSGPGASTGGAGAGMGGTVLLTRGETIRIAEGGKGTAATTTGHLGGGGGCTYVVGPNTAPTIGGTVAGQATQDRTAIKPSTTASVSHVGIGVLDSLTVVLSNPASGTLSGTGLAAGATAGTGTHAAATSATLTSRLQALTFTPTAREATAGSKVSTTVATTLPAHDGQLLPSSPISRHRRLLDTGSNRVRSARASSSSFAHRSHCRLQIKVRPSCRRRWREASRTGLAEAYATAACRKRAGPDTPPPGNLAVTRRPARAAGAPSPILGAPG